MMMNAMYEVPSRRIKKFEVTLDYAREQLANSRLQKLETA